MTDYVGADNLRGAELATEHLLGLGHRRIAFVGGPANSSARRDRVQGYRNALVSHGLPIDPALQLTSSTTREGGHHGIRALLERGRSTNRRAVLQRHRRVRRAAGLAEERAYTRARCRGHRI